MKDNGLFYLCDRGIALIKKQKEKKPIIITK